MLPKAAEVHQFVPASKSKAAEPDQAGDKRPPQTALPNDADQKPVPQDETSERAITAPPTVTKTPEEIRLEDFQKLGLRPDSNGHLPNYGYPRHLSGGSEGVNLPGSKTTFQTFIAPLRKEIEKTHHLLEISGDQNNCWMRASWISVLATTSPEDLAHRLRACAGSTCTPLVERDINTVTQLSRKYHQKPFADGSIKNVDTERFLRALQFEIVASYSHDRGNRNTGLVGELKTLRASNARAISDLPADLHRALNLPAMVIEVGLREQVGDWGVIRVAVPDNSVLAAETASWNTDQRDGQIRDRIVFLLNQFRDAPILWLQSGHYTVFMPKANTAPWYSKMNLNWGFR